MIQQTIKHFGVTLNYIKSFNDDRKADRFISALVVEGKTATARPCSELGLFTVHVYSN